MEVRRKEENDIQIVAKSEKLFSSQPRDLTCARTHFPIDTSAKTTRGFFSLDGKALSIEFIVRKIRHFVSCESIFYVKRVVVFHFRSSLSRFLVTRDRIANAFSCFVPFIVASFAIYERMNYT